MDEGIPAVQAAVAAGYTRALRPVLMTRVSYDYRHGADGRSALAKAANRMLRWDEPLSGACCSPQSLLLFFVPSVFAMFHSRREAKRARQEQA